MTAAFTATALICAWWDWRTRRIPYFLTLPLLVMGLLAGPHWQTGLIVLAVLMGGFLLLRVLGRIAYGDADAVVGAAFGSLLGWPAVGVMLFASASTALAVQALRRRPEPYAYGPYIVGCGLVALFLQRYAG